MATISNITNNFENLNLKNKINKLEDSKMDSYVLRKHINYSISNSFIPKEINTISTFVPTMKGNLKSQVEELQKLQAEIGYVEEKIQELEVNKKMKLTKIEDLRCIIQRIADEECFDCVFTLRTSNRITTPRERCPSVSSSRGGKPRSDSRVVVRPVNNDLSTTTTTTVDVTSEETGETEGEGDGAKQAITGNCCTYCSSSSCCCTRHHLQMQRDLHLLQSLCYWQENIAAPKKLFKA